MDLKTWLIWSWEQADSQRQFSVPSLADSWTWAVLAVVRWVLSNTATASSVPSGLETPGRQHRAGQGQLCSLRALLKEAVRAQQSCHLGYRKTGLRAKHPPHKAARPSSNHSVHREPCRHSLNPSSAYNNHPFLCLPSQESLPNF